MSSRPGLGLYALCTIPLLAATLGTSACGGASSGMTHSQFEAGLRTLCKSARKDTSGTSSTSIKPAVRLLTALRALTPPHDTGVSEAAWHATIDQQLRDLRSVSTFYAREMPKLLRSFKRGNPTPKLPAGTGATAATLAQAFNSPTGRRFLRAQAALNREFAHHQQQFKSTMRRAGVQSGSGCGGLGK